VGKWGALLFLKKNFGPIHPFTRETEYLLEDERIFSSFLAGLLLKLEKLYSSSLTYREKLTQREEIYSIAKRDFEKVETTLQTNRFKGFGSASMNNATLLSVGLYHRHFNLFESVFEKKEGSQKALMLFVKGLAKKEGNMIDRMAL
jgi:predicted aminopeptidase